MGPLSGNPIWTKEDDFKLRKAAESGTSFESLARGDVKFSRKFSHQQLQDRWLAILYDPAVSAESSARMLEFEHSDSAPVLKIDNQGNIKDNTSLSGKRKPESIRKRYYAMRKKTRDHPLTPPSVLPATDIVEPLQINEPDGFLTYDAAHTADIFLDDNNQNNVAGEEESDEFQEIFDMLEDVGPELPPIDDQLNEYPIIERNENSPNVCPGGAESESQLFGYATTAVTSADILLAELQHNLMDLSTVDDIIPVMDADYIERFSSALLDSPNREEPQQHDYYDVDQFIDNFFYQETEILEEGSLPPAKPSASGIICVLNTEDPDIPANDDVFLLNLVPSPSNEMKMVPFKAAPSYPSSKSARASKAKDFKVPEPVIPKNNTFDKSQFPSPIIGSQFRSEKLRDHNIKDFFSNDGQDQKQIHSGFMSRSNSLPSFGKAVTIKTEDKMGSRDIFAPPTQLDSTGFNNGMHATVTNNGPHVMVVNNDTHAMFGNNDKHAMATIQDEQLGHVEIVSKELVDPTYEELFSSESGDEDDIPNFSDVEALILDEDPSLDEQNIFLNGIGSSKNLQTFKYENAETQMKMIRLEQAANSIAKKEMTSKGAFAVLQGLRMKFYIKKPEVLIGRATEEFKVDVDLGREAQNSRVSRRQAIIRMDHEGSFHMKNLSKYPIFVNCMEVTTNKSIKLTSSCLIEIKGMSFLFETNEACIKQYVDSVKNKTL